MALLTPQKMIATDEATIDEGTVLVKTPACRINKRTLKMSPPRLRPQQSFFVEDCPRFVTPLNAQKGRNDKYERQLPLLPEISTKRRTPLTKWPRLQQKYAPFPMSGVSTAAVDPLVPPPRKRSHPLKVIDQEKSISKGYLVSHDLTDQVTIGFEDRAGGNDQENVQRLSLASEFKPDVRMMKDAMPPARQQQQSRCEVADLCFGVLDKALALSPAAPSFAPKNNAVASSSSLRSSVSSVLGGVQAGQQQQLNKSGLRGQVVRNNNGGKGGSSVLGLRAMMRQNDAYATKSS